MTSSVKVVRWQPDKPDVPDEPDKPVKPVKPDKPDNLNVLLIKGLKKKLTGQLPVISNTSHLESCGSGPIWIQCLGQMQLLPTNKATFSNLGPG